MKKSTLSDWSEIFFWRVNMVGELIEMKHGKLEIPDGWDDDELEALLVFACTS